MLVFSTPLTVSLVPPHPLPSVNKYRGMYLLYTVCNGGEGRDRVVWRASTGVIHCVFDQIPNLQNRFTTPNKNLGGERASDR
jgi:hypothetical protein